MEQPPYPSKERTMVELNLASRGSVLQDPHEVGEKVGVYKPDWDPTKVAPGLSEWIPIGRLAHLQVLFSENPYFGPELRRYNAAPWWYRTEFRSRERRRTRSRGSCSEASTISRRSG